MSLEILSSKTGLDLCDQTPLTFGHNARLSRLKDRSGQCYIAKEATGTDGKLDLEGWMLEKLAAAGLPVPKVYWKSPVMLVMDELPTGGGKTNRFEEKAAEAMAALHKNKAEKFGLEKDTLIGPLHQPNPPYSNWTDFFRDQRMLHFARQALKTGQIDTNLMRDIETLASKLDEYLTDNSAPCLIHGDAWAGNILGNGTDLSGFIDPAIYYADPEIELAFVDLMGGMGAAFFDRYHDQIPERDGFWEIRRRIYQLYPLLVHTILYGHGYAQQVQQIVKRFSQAGRHI